MAIHFDLRGELEQREDRWAARHAGLGITVYGQTPSEASNRMRTAVDLLVQDFTLEEAIQYLRERGIDCVPVSPTGVSFSQSHVLTASSPAD